MRHVKDVLRFTHDQKLGSRAIAQSLGLSRNTIRLTLRRFAQSGLPWLLPTGLTDQVLENKLFPVPASPPGAQRPISDCAYIHQELQDHSKLNLALTQLWEEYKERFSNGFQYTRFCWFYHDWLGRRDLVMRQSHKAGEKLFVDYTDGARIVDPLTGALTPVQLFVSVWGASTFTYVEASMTQTLPDWINAHVRAFQYFGVAPHLLIPDNLKSAVIIPSLYEPTLNPSYQGLADHYGAAVLPARPRKPRDKAKLENGVLVAKRWILAVLRHRIFYSIAEFNAAIRPLLEKLNDRPLRKIQKSRRQLFDELDRPAARPLPDRPHEFALWKKATVNIDYRIEVDRHFYSVPCALVHQVMDLKVTASTVEVLHGGGRVATHAYSFLKGRHSTTPAHMPTAHQKHADQSPSRLLADATRVGPRTAELVQALFDARPHPEQGYRSALGILRLARAIGKDRLEAVCTRALAYKLFSCGAVRNILTHGHDKLPLPGLAPALPLPLHDNIRGGNSYATTQEVSRT
jgi:transposase